MAFVANLPTWVNTFDSWVWNPDTELYEQVHDDAECQFYVARWKMPVQIWAQYRGQRLPDEEKNFGHIYPLLLCPIDLPDVDRLDPFRQTNDTPPIVFLNMPPLGIKAYRVAQTEVRYAGFPNEHVASVIIPIRAGEIPPGIPIPGLPDSVMSSIVADPDLVPADDDEEVTITVTVLDALGDPCVGLDVTLANSGVNVNTSPSSVATDGSGVAVFTATSDVVQDGVTFTATCEGVEIGPSNAVDFAEVPGIPYVPNCSIVASPTSVPADGTTAITVTATLLDFYGDPCIGFSAMFNYFGVDLSFTGGVGGVWTTDSSGVITTDVTSNTSQTGVTFFASWDLEAVGPTDSCEYT